MQRAGYDVGSKFARGGISVATVAVVCFDLTIDKIDCIFIYSASSTKSEASIEERLEHESETNRRNDEEERRRERLPYLRKRA